VLGDDWGRRMSSSNTLQRTGAARVIGGVLPALKVDPGRLRGAAQRVPRRPPPLPPRRLPAHPDDVRDAVDRIARRITEGYPRCATAPAGPPTTRSRAARSLQPGARERRQDRGRIRPRTTPNGKRYFGPHQEAGAPGRRRRTLTSDRPHLRAQERGLQGQARGSGSAAQSPAEEKRARPLDRLTRPPAAAHNRRGFPFVEVRHGRGCCCGCCKEAASRRSLPEDPRVG
jgi:hypothetical protein